MGFFSWITQDTEESIPNNYSSREPFSVTMTDDKGNRWTENAYEGYGEFGGKDYYVLLSEMNGGSVTETRASEWHLGMVIAMGITRTSSTRTSPKTRTGNGGTKFPKVVLTKGFFTMMMKNNLKQIQ